MPREIKITRVDAYRGVLPCSTVWLERLSAESHQTRLHDPTVKDYLSYKRKVTEKLALLNYIIAEYFSLITEEEHKNICYNVHQLQYHQEIGSKSIVRQMNTLLTRTNCYFQLSMPMILNQHNNQQLSTEMLNSLYHFTTMENDELQSIHKKRLSINGAIGYYSLPTIFAEYNDRTRVIDLDSDAENEVLTSFKLVTNKLNKRPKIQIRTLDERRKFLQRSKEAKLESKSANDEETFKVDNNNNNNNNNNQTFQDILRHATVSRHQISDNHSSRAKDDLVEFIFTNAFFRRCDSQKNMSALSDEEIDQLINDYYRHQRLFSEYLQKQELQLEYPSARTDDLNNQNDSNNNDYFYTNTKHDQKYMMDNEITNNNNNSNYDNNNNNNSNYYYYHDDDDTNSSDDNTNNEVINIGDEVFVYFNNTRCDNSSPTLAGQPPQPEIFECDGFFLATVLAVHPPPPRRCTDDTSEVKREGHSHRSPKTRQQMTSYDIRYHRDQEIERRLPRHLLFSAGQVRHRPPSLGELDHKYFKEIVLVDFQHDQCYYPSLLNINNNSSSNNNNSNLYKRKSKYCQVSYLDCLVPEDALTLFQPLSANMDTPLRVGEEVLVYWEESNAYFPAKITRVRMNHNSITSVDVWYNEEIQKTHVSLKDIQLLPTRDISNVERVDFTVGSHVLCRQGNRRSVRYLQPADTRTVMHSSDCHYFLGRVLQVRTHLFNQTRKFFYDVLIDARRVECSQVRACAREILSIPKFACLSEYLQLQHTTTTTTTTTGTTPTTSTLSSSNQLPNIQTPSTSLMKISNKRKIQKSESQVLQKSSSTITHYEYPKKIAEKANKQVVVKSLSTHEEVEQRESFHLDHIHDIQQHPNPFLRHMLPVQGTHSKEVKISFFVTNSEVVREVEGEVVGEKERLLQLSMVIQLPSSNIQGNCMTENSPATSSSIFYLYENLICTNLKDELHRTALAVLDHLTVDHFRISIATSTSCNFLLTEIFLLESLSMQAKTDMLPNIQNLQTNPQISKASLPPMTSKTLFASSSNSSSSSSSVVNGVEQRTETRKYQSQTNNRLTAMSSVLQSSEYTNNKIPQRESLSLASKIINTEVNRNVDVSMDMDVDMDELSQRELSALIDAALDESDVKSSHFTDTINIHATVEQKDIAVEENLEVESISIDYPRLREYLQQNVKLTHAAIQSVITGRFLPTVRPIHANQVQLTTTHLEFQLKDSPIVRQFFGILMRHFQVGYSLTASGESNLLLKIPEILAFNSGEIPLEERGSAQGSATKNDLQLQQQSFQRLVFQHPYDYTPLSTPDNGLPIIDYNFGPDPVEYFLLTSKTAENNAMLLDKLRRYLHRRQLPHQICNLQLLKDLLDRRDFQDLVIESVVQRAQELIVLSGNTIYFSHSHGFSSHIQYTIFPTLDYQILLSALRHQHLLNYHFHYQLNSRDTPRERLRRDLEEFSQKLKNPSVDEEDSHLLLQGRVPTECMELLLFGLLRWKDDRPFLRQSPDGVGQLSSAIILPLHLLMVYLTLAIHSHLTTNNNNFYGRGNSSSHSQLTTLKSHKSGDRTLTPQSLRRKVAQSLIPPDELPDERFRATLFLVGLQLVFAYKHALSHAERECWMLNHQLTGDHLLPLPVVTTQWTRGTALQYSFGVCRTVCPASLQSAGVVGGGWPTGSRVCGEELLFACCDCPACGRVCLYCAVNFPCKELSTADRDFLQGKGVQRGSLHCWGAKISLVPAENLEFFKEVVAAFSQEIDTREVQRIKTIVNKYIHRVQKHVFI